MQREEMLVRLKRQKFCVIPTVFTYDMGVQYDYVNNEGCGTGIADFSSWPIFMFRSFNKKQWETLQIHAESKMLSWNDLDQSEISAIFSALDKSAYDENDILSILLEDLLRQPNIPEGTPIYVLFEPSDWSHGFGEPPAYYQSIDDLAKEFENRFVTNYTAWEDLDDEEMETWFHRLDSDFDDIPYFSCERYI